MNTKDTDNVPERIFAKACHPDSPNHNCTWSMSLEPSDSSVEYARVDPPAAPTDDHRQEINQLIDAIEQSIRGLSQPLLPTETATRIKMAAEYGLSYVAVLRDRLSRELRSAPPAPDEADKAAGGLSVATMAFD